VALLLLVTGTVRCAFGGISKDGPKIPLRFLTG